MRNHRNVNVKITRIELCDLLLATLALEDKAEKWSALHEKLKKQLEDFDTKLDKEAESVLHHQAMGY